MAKIKVERDSLLNDFFSQLVPTAPPRSEFTIKNEDGKDDVLRCLLSDAGDTRYDCEIKSETNSNISDLGVKLQYSSGKNNFKFKDDDSEDDPWPGFSSHTSSTRNSTESTTKPLTVDWGASSNV